MEGRRGNKEKREGGREGRKEARKKRNEGGCLPDKIQVGMAYVSEETSGQLVVEKKGEDSVTTTQAFAKDPRHRNTAGAFLRTCAQGHKCVVWGMCPVKYREFCYVALGS